MIAAIVFLSGFAVDWAWIYYMHWAGKKKAIPAAFWSMVLVLIGSFNVIEYTHTHWLVAAFAAGCFFGTYSAVRWGPK